jgi:hypothetical protein
MNIQPQKLDLSTGLQFPEEMSSDCTTRINRNYYMVTICIISIMLLIGLVVVINSGWIHKFLSEDIATKTQSIFKSLAGLVLFITFIVCGYAVYLHNAVNACTLKACVPPYKTEATEQFCKNFIANKAATQIGNRNREMWQGVPPGGIRLF